jgi:cytochrome c
MNDPLFANKIVSALLAAALLFFGLPQIAKAVLRGGAHHGAHGELKLAYPIDYTKGSDAAGPAAAVDFATLLATANPDAGKRRAAICTSCHSFEKGGANQQGPGLWGVVGGPVAAHAGFSYSGALKGLGGAWTFDRLNEYLTNPQKYAPGTAMSFAGIAKAEQRAEVIAYLASLSDSPIALPEPPAPAAETAPADAAPDNPPDDPPAAEADAAPG